MKNAPKWTPEFLEKCVAFENFMGWSKGSMVEDLMGSIRLAGRSDIEDGMRNGYLCIYFDDDAPIDLGTNYRANICEAVIHRDDMTNWDEFISTRLTMYLLGGECDED